MISAKEKLQIHKRITEEIISSEKMLEKYLELTKPIAPVNAIGRVSRMDAINNKSVNEAALRTAENNYRKLTYAIERIDEDDFGLCARCKNPIPTARLILIPHSNMCVNCAE